jgi:hypothetical protein
VKWGQFFGTTLIIVLILLVLWPRMKKITIKDKTIFFLFLIFGWGLSILDLPNIEGPMTWMRFFFKPFAAFME